MSVILLLYILIILLFLSAFFSSAETAMISLTPYSLKHKVIKKIPGAIVAYNLLNNPSRLISLILIGNNVTNISASAIATIIAMRLWGEHSVVAITALLTVIILIFCEIIPKTIAVLHPHSIAFPASYILTFLIKLLYPVVWCINGVATKILAMLGIKANKKKYPTQDKDELRTIITESSSMIPRQHRKMLLRILDLTSTTVKHIMLPANSICGINIKRDIDAIRQDILKNRHTYLPIYADNINNCLGFIHMKDTSNFLLSNEPQKALLMQSTQEPLFIPEHVDLYTQLRNFHNFGYYIAIVVDEYGDVQGLITLADILKEIMGDFKKSPTKDKGFYQQDDGSYVFNGTANVRDINYTLDWNLPIGDNNTISGLILETIGRIPVSQACVCIGNYYVEILHMQDGLVKTAKITPMQMYWEEE